MPAALTPDLPLFLDGTLGGICGAVAAFVRVVALSGSPAVAPAYGFTGPGVTVLGVGALAGALLRVLRRD